KPIHINLLRNFLKCCIDRVNKDAFFLRQYFEHYLRIYEKYSIYNNDLAMVSLRFELSSLEHYCAAIE
ncbi:hypothetical protein AB4140_19825, partial [Shewanella sp. 10N.286.51.B2]|uniref:hypothetical protein n=1 Tax=Shewanella sp. 10N.286.51.B2 TaxID=3229707 RepID=UPI003550F4C8